MKYPYIIVWEEPIWMMAAKLMLSDHNVIQLPLEDAKRLLKEFKRLTLGLEIEFTLHHGKDTSVTFWRLDDKFFIKVNDQSPLELSAESIQLMSDRLKESIDMREHPQTE